MIMMEERRKWVCDNNCCFFFVFFAISSDVSVEVPDELDLTALRGKGKQPNEEEMPADAPPQPGTLFIVYTYLCAAPLSHPHSLPMHGHVLDWLSFRLFWFIISKGVQVKKMQSDQYARVPKLDRMLTLFDPVIGLVELWHHLTETKKNFLKREVTLLWKLVLLHLLYLYFLWRCTHLPISPPSLHLGML
jgi:hypothetical protein